MEAKFNVGRFESHLDINATPLECGQVHLNTPEGVPAYHFSPLKMETCY